VVKKAAEIIRNDWKNRVKNFVFYIKIEWLRKSRMREDEMKNGKKKT
jgi:hypothetical protein